MYSVAQTLLDKVLTEVLKLELLRDKYTAWETLKYSAIEGECVKPPLPYQAEDLPPWVSTVGYTSDDHTKELLAKAMSIDTINILILQSSRHGVEVSGLPRTDLKVRLDSLNKYDTLTDALTFMLSKYEDL